MLADSMQPLTSNTAMAIRGNIFLIILSPESTSHGYLNLMAEIMSLIAFHSLRYPFALRFFKFSLE
jgi:hypothetical protein